MPMDYTPERQTAFVVAHMYPKGVIAVAEGLPTEAVHKPGPVHVVRMGLEDYFMWRVQTAQWVDTGLLPPHGLILQAHEGHGYVLQIVPQSWPTADAYFVTFDSGATFPIVAYATVHLKWFTKETSNYNLIPEVQYG